MDGIFASGLFREIYEYNENIITEVLKQEMTYKLFKINVGKSNIIKVKKRKSLISNNKIKVIR